MATSKSKAKSKKKPAAKKKPTVKKKTKAKNKPATKSGPGASSISAAEKQRLIQETAYFIAQQRGFAPGNEIQDWLIAEKKVNEII